MNRNIIILVIVVGIIIIASTKITPALFTKEGVSAQMQQNNTNNNMTENKTHSWDNFSSEMKAEKIKTLTPLQEKVTQHEGTESPVANEYNKNYEKGIYVDIVSGEPLFSSNDKYDSGTGWPSFVKPIEAGDVIYKTDTFLGYGRTEVRSKIADSHLGHMFDDGPTERGGKRFCMNSAALKFIPLADMQAQGYGDYIQYIK